jgi:hypothetical protein
MTGGAADAGSKAVRSPAAVAFSVAAAVCAVAAVAFSWARLFVGMDMYTEGYYVIVPWRWALGDTPFVNNIGLDQMSALFTYPFVKAFALVTGGDPTGLLLYTRHLYLLAMIGVALAVFAFLRHLVRWQLAIVVAAVYVTYVSFATPQLSYGTICAACTTVGAALGGAVLVNGKGRWYALGSGVAFGVAVVAYPSLGAVIPVWAAFFVVAQRRRVVSWLMHDASRSAPGEVVTVPWGTVWRRLGFWALGGALVLASVAVVLAILGLDNLAASTRSTLSSSGYLHQLGGTDKVRAVVDDLWYLVKLRALPIVALLLVYFVFARRPRLGRGLLAALPLVLWISAQKGVLEASGYVIVYALLVPYLYLFVPRERRETGARLLLWVWPPAVVAGVVTAYSSSFGYVNAALGLTPALFAGGLFLAWALEAVVAAPASVGERGDDAARADEAVGRAPRGERRPWFALATLAVVLAVTIAFQFQFQQFDRSYRELTSRVDSGPWMGIEVTPRQHQFLDQFEADLQSQAQSGDQLLIFNGVGGLYLYWDGAIASNYYWMFLDPETEQLPPSTVDYYRSEDIVPTLVVHMGSTKGLTPEDLQASCAGLEYPPTLIRPTYAFQRKPAGETTADVLARLPGD